MDAFGKVESKRETVALLSRDNIREQLPLFGSTPNVVFAFTLVINSSNRQMFLSAGHVFFHGQKSQPIKNSLWYK